MTDGDTKRIQEGLLKAYEMIRSQSEVICDLMNLVAPLVKALDVAPELGQAYLRAQHASSNESIRLKIESLAVVDDAIRHLRDEMKR